MAKEKILYVITKSSFGGAQRYVYDLATNLPKERFEIIVAFGGNGKLNDMLAKARIRAICLPKLGRDIKFVDEFAVFFALYSLFKNEKPDVLHLNSSKIGGLGALAGRVYNLSNFILNLLKPKTYSLQPAKIIFTAHGWAFKEDRPWLQKIIIHFLSWLTVTLCHKVIVVSKNDMERSPGFFIPNGKIIHINNGIKYADILGKIAAKNKIFGVAGLKPEKGTLLIGSGMELNRNKGLRYLIEALPKINRDRQSVLVIMGEGGEKNTLLKEAVRFGVVGNIIFTGFVENAFKLLSAFDIFVLPSVKEGLPYTLLEAGQAKLPVIATSVGGIPEIIEDMKTGILVRPKQPRELASAVKFLLNNPDKAKDFGKNLHNKVSKEFSLEEMLEKTIALYK